jgi:hypothetical protein
MPLITSTTSEDPDTVYQWSNGHKFGVNNPPPKWITVAGYPKYKGKTRDDLTRNDIIANATQTNGEFRVKPSMLSIIYNWDGQTVLSAHGLFFP